MLLMYPDNVSAAFLSPGELSTPHQKLSGLSNCTKCHSLGKGISDSACKACHEKLVQRMSGGRGLHGNLKDKCITCHREHKGRNHKLIDLDRNNFDHSITGYSLLGSHQQACDKCHTDKKTFLGLSQACINCHTDVHKDTLPDDCIQCHNYQSWDKVSFDHNSVNKFRLTGKHRDAKCERCHPSQVVHGKRRDFTVMQFGAVPSIACDACHVDVHNGKLRDKTCSKCHSPEGWRDVTFDRKRHESTGFPLTGKHRALDCDRCHMEREVTGGLKRDPVKRRVRQLTAINHDECSACHTDVHEGQFEGKKCTDCHSVERAWKETGFDHNGAGSPFVLEGKHREAACDLCHKRAEKTVEEFGRERQISIGVFRGVNHDECSACYTDVHEGQFEWKKYSECNRVGMAWKDTGFDDNCSVSPFVLLGVHMEL